MKSITKRWLISYLAVLTVPIVVSLAVYAISVDTLVRETNRVNEAVSFQLKDILDSRFKDMDQVANQLSRNEDLQVLRLQEGPLSVAHRVKLLSVVTDLTTMRISRDYLDGISIYLRSTGSLIRTNGFVKLDAFKALSLEYSELTGPEWDAVVKSTQFRGLHRFGPSPYSESDRLYFTRVVSIQDPTLSDVVVIFKVNYQEFLSGIQNSLLLRDSQLLIDQGSADFSLSYGKSFLPAYPKDSQHNQNGIARYQTAQGNYVVTTVASEVLDVTSHILTPESVFYGRANAIFWIILVSLLVCLVIGVLLAQALIKRNYQPLKELIVTVNQKRRKDRQLDQDEYSFLTQTLEDLLNEETKQETLETKERRFLRDNYLSRLLKGTIQAGLPDYEVLHNYDLDLPFPHVAVLVCRIKDITRFEAGRQAIDHNQNYELATSLLEKFLSELWGEEHRAHRLNLDGLVVALTSLSVPTDEVALALLVEKATKLSDLLEGNFGIAISTGISSVYSSLTSGPSAFQEALSSLDYGLMVDQSLVCFSDIPLSIQATTASRYSFPLSLEQQLLNVLLSGDGLEADKLFDEVLQRNSVGPWTARLSKYLGRSLHSTLTRAVVESTGNKGVTFIEENLLDHALEQALDAPRAQKGVSERGALGDGLHRLAAPLFRFGAG